MVTLPPIPERIASLPRDERGYPVPWFVTWFDGKPEFRVADGKKFAAALKNKLCWVCGNWLYAEQTFVLGPMCTVTRSTAEPPCHFECAEFSAQACPFLSMPKAVRREANLPNEGVNDSPGGIAIKRNPGCCALWDCHSGRYSRFSDGRGGSLFKVPDPDRVVWYAEGRLATRAEVLKSIEEGLPILIEKSYEDAGHKMSRDDRKALDECRERAMQYLPA